jgi:sterol desaturase/sphingolipid hydroxylase (fatty acid hydroxylase superfamily)
MTNANALVANWHRAEPAMERRWHSGAPAHCPGRWFVRWLLWPTLATTGATLAWLAITRGWDYGGVYSAYIFGILALLCLLEFVFPYQVRWRMTLRSFLRDLKYFAANGAAIGLISAGLGLVSIKLGANAAGPLSDVPLYVAVPLALIVFEFLNYWQHRAMHELGGRVGGFLWRVHAAHHLPDRVYTLMHAAGHPINTVVVRAGTMILPWYLLGLSPEALLLVNMINNLQGILSHVNLDVRAGWANYLLVGTELHRYHHSADPREGKNYAATLSVFDIAHGTFYYRPGRVPDRLGVQEPELYPTSFEFRKVMGLPFVHARGSTRRVR